MSDGCESLSVVQRNSAAHRFQSHTAIHRSRVHMCKVKPPCNEPQNHSELPQKAAIFGARNHAPTRRDYSVCGREYLAQCLRFQFSEGILALRFKNGSDGTILLLGYHLIEINELHPCPFGDNT